MRIRRQSLMREAAELLDAQRGLIALLKAQKADMQLEHARSTRDLIEQFWICQEGGIDVREPLLIGLQDLRDQVARLEEHHA